MSEPVFSALFLSLEVALLSVLFGVPIAVFAGYRLSRSGFWTRTVLGIVSMAPLVFPPVVTGLLLLHILGRHGLSGLLGIQIPFTFFAALIAAIVVGLPLAIISARQAFDAVDPGLEEISWTLGVPRRSTFFRVTLPLAWPGIMAGAVLMFARSLGEFGATIVVAGNTEGSTRTIPLAIYTWLESLERDGDVLLLVALSSALSLIAVVVFEVLRARSEGPRHGR